MLSVSILNVVRMQIVIMMSVVLVIAVLLNVVAPLVTSLYGSGSEVITQGFATRHLGPVS